MPQISKITLPSGTTYDIKDAQARSQIQALTGGDAVVFMGVSTTQLTDGGNQIPTVGGNQKTPAAGQLFFYGTQEFIYGNDSKWHALGSLESLGDLAYKDTASTSYKPAGTVSKPTFTGSSSSVTITATDNTSGNYQPKGTVSKPTFTGSSSTFTGKFTPSGTVSVTTNATTNKTATVSAAASGTATYTPGRSISQPTFTGTKARFTGTTTATGQVSQPTFTGTSATITVS